MSFLVNGVELEVLKKKKKVFSYTLMDNYGEGKQLAQ